MSISVVLADDDSLMLRALEDLLRSEGDFEVLAQAANADEALRSVRANQPDILVLDMRMPGKDGLAVMREMRRAKLRTRVVLWAESLDDKEMLAASRLGVGGVVLKEMAPRLLVQCIRKVHAGDAWLERYTVARAFEVLRQLKGGLGGKW